MRRLFVSGLVFVACACGGANAMELAKDGKTAFTIVVDPAAIAAETNAAKELADTLGQITGAKFEITTNVGKKAVFVGPGSATRAAFRDVPFDELGNEELVIRTSGDRLMLAGGRPRGTLYAVSTFLQGQCGVRWWTPWASHVPKHGRLSIPKLAIREQPAFEYREPYWFTAFDAKWSVRNRVNGTSSRIPPDLGGRVIYRGFVHTFWPLVPPEKYFAQHPEWYSLVGGKRSRDAQLCLTNPELRDFVTAQVKAWLRESPDATIISVSQNDINGRACECEKCKAIDDAEGGHSGSMLDFVNAIAERIEPEFPNVAVDTLAYQYTRKPPRTIKPRANVIVRLCSIECNFREPLSAPANASFGDDIRNWSKICDRLYVWNYVTDFGHYVQPHPNWFSLDDNIRFFAGNHVRGIFDEGAYQSYGSEMSELRAWVTAQLFWNPKLDGGALIDEFLAGYYGPAAKPIRSYLDLMHKESTNWNLTCYSPATAPFLHFRPLAHAERLWQHAEETVAADPELLARVKLGHLALGHVWLARWDALRDECEKSDADWPLPASKREYAEAWLKQCQGDPARPWTHVTRLNEPGLTPEKFAAPMLTPAR